MTVAVSGPVASSDRVVTDERSACGTTAHADERVAAALRRGPASDHIEHVPVLGPAECHAVVVLDVEVEKLQAVEQRPGLGLGEERPGTSVRP